MKFIYQYCYYKLFLFAKKIVQSLVYSSAKVEAGFYYSILFGINMLNWGLFFHLNEYLFLLSILIFHFVGSHHLTNNAYDIEFKMGKVTKTKKIIGEIFFWVFIGITMFSVIGLINYAL